MTIRGLRPAPQGIEHLRHFCHTRPTDRQRQQAEAIKHALQEWQLHLDRMFGGMGGPTDHDLRQRTRGGDQFTIERDRAEG